MTSLSRKVASYFSLLFFLILTEAASAQTQPNISGNFHYSSNRTFYSCDFIEWRAESILNDMMADFFDVNCSGGLEMRSPFISLSYRFNFVPAQEMPRGKIVRFNEYSFNDTWGAEGVGCDITIDFIRQLLRSIPAELNPFKINQMNDFCWGSRGSFLVELEVK